MSAYPDDVPSDARERADTGMNLQSYKPKLNNETFVKEADSLFPKRRYEQGDSETLRTLLRTYDPHMYNDDGLSPIWRYDSPLLSYIFDLRVRTARAKCDRGEIVTTR